MKKKHKTRFKKELLLVLMTILVSNNMLFGQTYTIPTVVHIISPNAQNILLTDAQIRTGIANVNKQFKGEYATGIINTIISQHRSYINDANIKFELATKDPNGNPTDGITRTINYSWSTAPQSYEDSFKTALAWERSKYLNIYVVEIFNTSGVAYRPSEVADSGRAIKDGAMITYRIWPTQFPLSSPQWPGFEGTMAHELGHYLNLSHVWGQTNSATTCNNPICDDFVADTPKQSGTLNGFVALQEVIQCDNLVAMTDNFMSYSRHQCVFTPGQVARMHNALNSPVSARNNLWSAANLAATGTGSGTIIPPTSYCVATGRVGTVEDYINNVSIGTINNTSTQTVYSDFTSQSTTIEKGMSYPISITLDEVFSDDQAYAWADWNGDTIFNNVTELINMSAYTNKVATGTITVPTDAIDGPIRLRTRNIYGNPNLPQACGDIYGEVEDYTLIITGASSNSYCIATGRSGTGTDYINNVSIGTIDNASTKTAYSDFTSQSTEVEKGRSYALSITLNEVFSDDQAYAWADWNGDSVFSNTTELIDMSVYTNKVATGTIMVPNDAIDGPIRLRTRNIYGNPNSPQACGDIFGEVEDYTLDIMGATSNFHCAATGRVGTTTDYISNVAIGTINNTSTKTAYSDFTSQSTDVEKGMSYTIKITLVEVFSDDQAYAWVDWNRDAVFDNATELITMSAYEDAVAIGTIIVPTDALDGPVKLRTRNIYGNPNLPEPCGDIYGEVEDYTLNVIDASSNSYCAATGRTGTTTDYINNVTIGTINNASSKTAYSDFTSQSTTIEKGMSYPISITLANVFSDDQAYAWADWNGDMVFDNATELITMSAYNNKVATGIITVPTNAIDGPIRLRTRNIYGNPNLPEPCGDIYGEIEDYTLNIINTTSNAYCEATGRVGTTTDYINNVAIGTINNASTKTAYSDFTSQSTNVTKGRCYSISISLNKVFSKDQAYAWADWNGDKVFDNVTELIAMSAYNNSVAIGTFTVPSNAIESSIRLRVRNIYGDPNLPESCGDIYGEVEDYTLNVQAISASNNPCTEENLSLCGNLNGAYHGINTITTTGTTAETVTLKAGQSITLSPGFHAGIDSDFLAKIEACPAAVIQKSTTERNNDQPLFSVLTSKLRLQAYPNPFNHQLTIDYSLAKTENINLFIMDIMGKRVANLIQEVGQQAGKHHQQFQLNEQMEEGVYFLVLKTEEQYITKQLVLLKN